MRSTLALPLALAGIAVGAAAHAAGAQRTRVFASPAPDLRPFQLETDDQPRAVLGLTTGGAANARDTLGLLVTSIVPNGPADRAGLEEGNRLAAINGVSLRVAPADTGDWELTGAMNRRLTRELGKVKPGDDVELRVYSGGQTRAIRIRTADSDSLYQRRRATRGSEDDRASLGIGIAMTGSKRDTLGVFIMSVDDSGPAARAGIEEGNRIAAIDGVDLRVASEDAGDDAIGSARVRRLQREIAKLHPGDDAELRVYANGQFRTVHLKTVRQSELPRRRRSFFMTGDGMGMLMPPMPPMPPGVMRLDGARIGDDVRRALEGAMEGAGRALDGLRWLPGDMYQHDDLEETPPSMERAPTPRAREDGGVRVRTPGPSTLRSALLDANDAGGAALEAVASGLERTAPTPAVAYAFGGGHDDVDLPDGSDAEAISIGGLRLVPVRAELASYLGAGSERGLLVLAVPSWAGDLRAGDVILSVDGRPVRSGDNGETTTIAFGAGHDTAFEVLRGGSVRTIEVPARR